MIGKWWNWGNSFVYLWDDTANFFEKAFEKTFVDLIFCINCVSVRLFNFVSMAK